LSYYQLVVICIRLADRYISLFFTWKCEISHFGNQWAITPLGTIGKQPNILIQYQIASYQGSRGHYLAGLVKE
jgi:hypothetical protein